MIKDVSAWLKKTPSKKEIVEIQDGPNKKVKVIPQKIIETLLDELTEQNWSTVNFQFTRWNEYEEQKYSLDGETLLPPKLKRTMCDAALELVVTYRVKTLGPLNVDKSVYVEKEITRKLVGAVTFDVAFYGHDHIANTAKSLCITNAASDLGRRFGKDLNPNITPVISSLAPSASPLLKTIDKIQAAQ